MDLFPILSPPVVRPEVVMPWTTVDVENGTIDELVSVYLHLTHGANYDDPSPWVASSFAARKQGR
ncbi:MAG: cyanobactin biosynthesis system PatB/AcyB/McaB family protein [Actinomycetales bacterium]|nr:cyanobactin biosynthesis system PatB/AcyB/McaB family protein [Actinomycetales bacterium]